MWLLANRFRSWDKKRVLINSVEFIWSVAERIAPKDKLNSKVKIPFHAEISWISCVASDWCQNVTSVTINVFFIDVCDWFSRFRDTSLLICHFNTNEKIKQENEIMSVIQSGCWAFVDKQNSIFDWISYKPNATENAVFFWNSLKSILKKTALSMRATQKEVKQNVGNNFKKAHKRKKSDDSEEKKCKKSIYCSKLWQAIDDFFLLIMEISSRLHLSAVASEENCILLCQRLVK